MSDTSLKNTTIRIDAVRREALKDAAFNVSMDKQEIVSMSDILKYLIDNFTEDAVQKLKEENAKK